MNRQRDPNRAERLSGGFPGAAALVALAVVTACSTSATDRSYSGGRGGDWGGTGGALSTGGAAPSGGGSGAGSPSGSGGGFASGGAPDSGGMPGAGGAAAGGASAGGAVAATGGVPANGGSPGAGGVGTGGAVAGTGGAPTNQVDVYLIGGQSNATGQGYAKNLPNTFTVDTNVMLYHSPGIVSGAAARSWVTLRPASEGTDGCNLGLRFGPELGFGNAIRGYTPDRSIYLIKHATSNTGLAIDWTPGANAADSAHFGPEFQTFVATVDGGLNALKSMGKTPVIRAMLWQQGERDVDMAGTAAVNYGQNLRAFIARVREQWSSPNMLFVYGYIYPASNYGAARDQVRKGQADVDQDSGSALATQGAFVVSGDALSLRANDPGSCYPSDKIHFGTQGQLDLGKLMADTVRQRL